jgi:serine/threonine protein kinase
MAFRGSRLKVIRIPPMVERIGRLTFSGCNGLRKVVVCGNRISFDSCAFQQAAKDFTVYTNPNVVVTGLDRIAPIADGELAIEIEENSYEAVSGMSLLRRSKDFFFLPSSVPGIPYTTTGHGTVSAAKKFELTGGVTLAKIILGVVEVLRLLSHVAIIRIHGFIMPTDSDPTTWILTEYCRNGTLEALLERPDRDAILTPLVKTKLIVGMVLALRYMHACGVYHLALNPSKLMFNGRWEVKVSEFQHAGKSSDESTAWSAPEILAVRSYEYLKEWKSKVDVYAFGIIVWQILTGRKPFVDLVEEDRDRKIVQEGLRPEPLTGIDERLAELIQNCWTAKPENRPSFAQIFEYLTSWDLDFIPGTNMLEVREYVYRILEVERQCPPKMPETNLDDIDVDF